jgi:hypothetical protein
MYVLTVHACISLEKHLPFQPTEVNILQGDSYENKVMNFKFKKKIKLHFGVLEVTCHVATVRWQWCSAVHCTVENAWADSLHTSTLYITHRCKAIGLTCLCTIMRSEHQRSLRKWRQLWAWYLQEVAIMCTRSIWLTVIQGKSCWMYLEICTPFGKLHIELSTFG